jgi:hypothetical protein
LIQPQWTYSRIQAEQEIGVLTEHVGAVLVFAIPAGFCIPPINRLTVLLFSCSFFNDIFRSVFSDFMLQF